MNVLNESMLMNMPLFYCSQHEGLGQEYFSPQETCVSGICTGALSAAAVSCCRTASELVPIAVQTVLVAFRLGMCTLRAAKAIDPSEGNWSMVVSCDSTDKVGELLCKFSESNVRMMFALLSG